MSNGVPLEEKRGNRLVSAFLAAGIGLIVTVPAAWFSAYVLKDYGLALFLGAPFCLGFLSCLVYRSGSEAGLGEMILVSLLAVAGAGAIMLLFAFDGLICLIMAAPIAAGLAVLGAFVAFAIRAAFSGNGSTRLFCVAFLALPVSMGLEHWKKPEAPVLNVTSRVDIQAPPEVVWRHVVTFAELPPPTETIFKTGIAYPIRAEIEGKGRGAMRRCVFSTGAFEEPIETWDEPRLLQFSVTKNPAPMHEFSPWGNVHPPHLDGYLVSQRGQFLLTPLPGGGTRLEGSTWYQHHLWPAKYWQLWSDFIIHRIHLRVLNHIKALAEEDNRN